MHPLVKSIERDQDGFWVYLKPGYQVHGDHAIVENTKRAAMLKLNNVGPCECPDCKRELGI